MLRHSSNIKYHAYVTGAAAADVDLDGEELDPGAWGEPELELGGPEANGTDGDLDLDGAEAGEGEEEDGEEGGGWEMEVWAFPSQDT